MQVSGVYNPKVELFILSRSHITCVCEHHFCYTCGAPFEIDNGRYHCTGGENCAVWEEQNPLDD
ncbi:hypothetical protein K438DRAFT_1795377 [Mycena galopus ATCC 62051]|nr:hypothetical protein K438DRAFT_1795377 [Mycena galopus ATCC 62051]